MIPINHTRAVNHEAIKAKNYLIAVKLELPKLLFREPLSSVRSFSWWINLLWRTTKMKKKSVVLLDRDDRKKLRPSQETTVNACYMSQMHLMMN